MNARWASAVVVVMAFGTTARAEPVTLTDFAYGFSLDTDGDGAIYRLPLPEDVYRSATRPDLGDMRVFNRVGEWVPHAIDVAPDPPAPIPDEALLPLFPFREAGDRERPRLDLDVRTDENGAIVRVQEQAPKAPSSRIGGYLLDASALSRPIDGLRLVWTRTDENVVSSVRLEESDDLAHWRSLVDRATVADLRYEGNSLEVRTIAVPVSRSKYLRLTLAEGSPSLALTEAWASLVPHQKSSPRRWSALASFRTEGEPTTFVFESAGVLPVDRIRMHLGQPNTLIQGAVQSRPDNNAPWRVRHKGLLYHVTVEGLTLESDAVTIPLTHDRYWRLELEKESSESGKLQPSLELGWVPQDLYFLAHGEAPFTLAFGSATVGPASQPVDELLNVLQDGQKQALIKDARVDHRTEIGGVDRLKLPPPPLPWKAWLLWAVLAFGVLLLAVLAWRLYRDMNRPAS